MRRIALIPVHNEESTLIAVLQAVTPRVTALLVVDDGSSDGSLSLARDWSAQHSNVEILSLTRNLGMSAALREGFSYLSQQLREDRLEGDDLLFTIDADGQHDPGEIQALADHMTRNGLDVALTRRDFSLYPRYKRAGNTLMTLWGSALSGYRYGDIESGFRGMRMKVLPQLLEYYTGRRYSCAQEIAILTARLGFRVDNSFRTVIQLYRSQTSLKDVLVNATLGLWAFLRWSMDLKLLGHRPAARTRLPRELS